MASFLLIFNALTANATSRSWCYLTDNPQAPASQQLRLAERTLICEKESTLKNRSQSTTLYDKEQLAIVRGNIYEINNLPVTILHQSHGYSLVLKKDLSELTHDHHLNVINIDDFKPLIKTNIKSPRSSQPHIQALVDQVNPNAWLADIVTLSSWSRRTGEAGNVSAANWIENKFQQLNLAVSKPSFNVGQTNTNNIMAIQSGTTRPDDWYVVGGHMDSIANNAPNAPGAVDNASGCAAVLEMARIASAYHFAGSIIFICYSGEEQGLYGSEFHANTLIANNNDEKIKAALTMDMVGYIHNSQHELLVESSASYQWLMNSLVQNAATYAPNLSVITSTNYFGSDHVSYIDNDMPGVLSIDNDYSLYPNYHRSTDLPENINLSQGESIIKTNLATLAELAEVLGVSDLIYRNGFD